ncbi:MAG: hypothetical protein RLZZ142_273 [Verrucomicrobiota bacterium]
MKIKLASVVQGLLLALGVMGISGCVDSGWEYPTKPTKVPGFNPTTSLDGPQQELPPVDPSAPVAPAPTPGPSSLPDPLPSPLSPDPTPASIPAPAAPVASGGANSGRSSGPLPPAPSQAPAPAPTTPPAAPQPKPPLVAKRVAGQPTWIVNPYTGKTLQAVDEKGKPFPSGLKVRDPETGEIMVVP